MPGSLTWLEPVSIEGHTSSGLGSDEHPMRIMTRRAAGLLQPAWDDDAREAVARFFDDLAPEWHTRSGPPREAVVADALERGLAIDGVAGDLCVELGSGIGAYTPLLAHHWQRVMATEVSPEMLRRSPASPGLRVLADGARLPVADGAADAVALVNCFLFPAEVDRVLSADGVVAWVNSSGDQTPIYLPPDDVVDALPGRWEAVASHAGVGVWCVARRA